MKLLADSDFFFGLFVNVDAHHSKCISLLKKCIDNDYSIVALNLVIQETATVISKKRNQGEATLFLDELSKMPVKILFAGEDDENLIWDLFNKQTKKGTSFIDCANLTIAKKYKFDKILSFDEFYPKDIRF